MPGPIGARPSACRFRCPPLPEPHLATGLHGETVRSSTSSRSIRGRRKSAAAIRLLAVLVFACVVPGGRGAQRKEEDHPASSAFPLRDAAANVPAPDPLLSPKPFSAPARNFLIARSP